MAENTHRLECSSYETPHNCHKGTKVKILLRVFVAWWLNSFIVSFLISLAVFDPEATLKPESTRGGQALRPETGSPILAAGSLIQRHPYR